VLQCVAVCCSVLRCVALCGCSALCPNSSEKKVSRTCSRLCEVAWVCVLQCVAACCSVWQCHGRAQDCAKFFLVCVYADTHIYINAYVCVSLCVCAFAFGARVTDKLKTVQSLWVAVRCGALRCVAVCCGVLRCVAVCCGVLQ